MGFLKFLKKKEKDVDLDESLDIPPPPPAIKPILPKPRMEESELPKDLPPFKFEEETPTSESKLPELPKEDMHDLDIPGFPSLEEEHEFTPKPPMKEHEPDFPLPEKEPMEHEAMPEEDPEHEYTGSVAERRPLGRIQKRPHHIRLDKFKETLKNINKIRSDLKKSDDVLHKLVKSIGEEGSGFEKWKNTMGDIQKKLIFVDKTLFKGD